MCNIYKGVKFERSDSNLSRGGGPWMGLKYDLACVAVAGAGFGNHGGRCYWDLAFPDFVASPLAAIV